MKPFEKVIASYDRCDEICVDDYQDFLWSS